MNHKFFEGVVFEDVLTLKIPAPWVPELKTQRDTVFFENYPETRESAENLPTEFDEEVFGGF